MISRRPTFRAAALLAAGAFAVHQLSYALDSGAALEGAGRTHGYLALVAPIVALLLALACGQFLARLARAARTGRGAGRSRASSTRRMWAAASAALLAIYLTQEGIERVLAGGHSHEPGAVILPGGLYAVALAFAIGALIALAVRGADVAVAAVAARRRRDAARRPRPMLRARAAFCDLERRDPIAAKLAGRAPPITSV